MASTLMAPPSAVLLSPVAMATMAADLLSATKRMPSGPKVSWFMDLMTGFPVLKPSVQLTAWARVPHRPSTAAMTANELWMVLMVGWSLMVECVGCLQGM